jgi:hypothetical protein
VRSGTITSTYALFVLRTASNRSQSACRRGLRGTASTAICRFARVCGFIGRIVCPSLIPLAERHLHHFDAPTVFARILAPLDVAKQAGSPDDALLSNCRDLYAAVPMICETVKQVLGAAGLPASEQKQHIRSSLARSVIDELGVIFHASPSKPSCNRELARRHPLGPLTMDRPSNISDGRCCSPQRKANRAACCRSRSPR